MDKIKEYIDDSVTMVALDRAHDLCRKYNLTSPYEKDLRKSILEELFNDKFEKIYIEPPFFCDMGVNIKIGKNFYANCGTVILDCTDVTIGDNVMIAPNVQIYAVGHPLEPEIRALGTHINVVAPVTIGNNVWIGGNVTILPGITIGDGSVIGAGSVVTKNVPPNTLVAGNPCKVIKKL